MNWYMIPGYNGYEINGDGIIRSMKMMWKNPGYRLKKYVYKDGTPYYKLTDDNNIRRSVTVKEIWASIQYEIDNNGKSIQDFIRQDDWIYLGSRNKITFKDPIVKHQKEENVVLNMSGLIEPDEPNLIKPVYYE